MKFCSHLSFHKRNYGDVQNIILSRRCYNLLFMVSKNNILPWDTLNFYYATYLRKKKKNSLVFPTRMYQRISTLVSFIQWRSTNLINKRYGSLTMQQMIWLWNHTSYRKFNFNEFIANVLRDNMGMFDLWGCLGW